MKKLLFILLLIIFSFNAISQNDVGITKIMNQNQLQMFDTVNYKTPIIILKNFGINNLTSVTIQYSINNNTPIDYYWMGNLTLNQTDTINLSPFFLQMGYHSFKVYTNSPNNTNDINAANDSCNIFINNYGIKAPFLETFESLAVGATQFSNIGWLGENDSITDVRWIADNDGTTYSLTGPTVDHTTGTTSGIYLLAQMPNYIVWYENEGRFTSPCIDLDTLQNPHLVFWYHMHGQRISNLKTEIYSNGIWTEVDNIWGQQQGATTWSWKSDTIDLSNYNGQNIKIRFTNISNGMLYGDIAIDDIEIFNNYTQAVTSDIALIYLNKLDFVIPPQNSPCTPQIAIKNCCSDTLTSVNINYAINNGNIQTYNWSGQLLPYQKDTFDLPSVTFPFGTCEYLVYTSQPNNLVDGNNSNDTISTTINNHIYSAPLFENFESFTVGNPGIFNDGWDTERQANMKWRVNSGSSTGYSSGPSIDHTLSNSTGKYVYSASVTSAFVQECSLITPCINLDTLRYPALSFWYFMYGNTMEDLFIEIYHNNAWENLHTISGQHQFWDQDDWLCDTIDLYDYIGQDIRIRFRTPTTYFNHSDIAIDDFAIFDDWISNTQNDGGIVEILYPDSLLNYQTNPISPEISIRNYGNINMNNLDINYTVDGVNISTYSWSGNLAPDEIDTIVLPSIIFPSGNSNFTVYSSNPNLQIDEYRLNDSTSKLINNGYKAPYFEDFESFDNGFLQSVYNGWTNIGSYMKWTIDNNTTSSVSTGPVFDHTLGTIYGKYIYSEIISSTNPNHGELISPPIYLDTLNRPSLTFWYHMHGYRIDSLEVEILSNNTWEKIHTIIGEHQTAYADPYLSDTLDLRNYTNEIIKIRFTSHNNGGYGGDIAIDDVEIFDDTATYLQYDALIRKILVSERSICADDTTLFTPRVIIKNNGDSTINQLDISYKIDNGPITNYVWSGNLVADQIDTVNLPPTSIPLGSPVITAYTTSVNSLIDQNLSNDTAYLSIFNGIYQAPYFEDFETFNTNNPENMQNGWQSKKENNYRWLANSGGTPNYWSGPSNDHTLGTNTGIYLYAESTNTDNGDQCKLTSPCINLGSMQNPYLTFWYHMYGNGTGSLKTEILINNTWINIHNISGEQQNSNTSLWSSTSLDLSNYIGYTIYVRFTSSSTGSDHADIAIDDISIVDFIPPISDFTISTDTACVNQLVHFTDNSINNPTQWQWTFFGADTVSSSLQNPSTTWSTSGNYNISLITSNAYGSNTMYKTIYIDDCIGINENEILSNLSIFPNPANTNVTITYNLVNENNLVLDIYDSKASLILSRDIQSGIGEHSETINVKNFPKGIYYIKIGGNEFIKNEKLIIE